MRIATVQMAMKWDSRANVETICLTNAYARNLDVDVIIYPELAVTGYHREVRKEVAETLSDPSLLQEVAASAREQSLFVWIGAPTESTNALHNSYQCYSPVGHLVCQIHKNGLTPNEEILFTGGHERPIFAIDSWTVSAFLCRESADLPILTEQFGAKVPDILLWPGYIGNCSANPEGTSEQAIKISKALSAHVVQSNWANSLNAPEQKDLGGSIVTHRDGSLIGRCPDAEPGIGVVDLDKGQFFWDPTHF